MFDEVQSWWQNIIPETQANIQAVGVAAAGLLGGHVLGTMASRTLRARNFDTALRLSGGSPARPETDHGITPTFIAGLLVRLTVWAGTAWWLARQYGQAELASNIGLIINRTWGVAAVVLAAVALGGLMANRLIDCLHGASKPAPETLSSRNGVAASRWDPARVVGAVAYILAVLLVLLIAADVFDWPLTRGAALALWQFAQHLLVAGAALFIGCIGAGWARDLATSEGAASPEKRAGQYTALGVMAGTTVLAVAVLLSTAGVLIGLAALAILGLLLWLVRDHLPDVTAGLQLRAHRVREIWLDGEAWQVSEVGLLTTQVCRGGTFGRLPNRRALEARMQEAAVVPR
jgi:hypothetical protein